MPDITHFPETVIARADKFRNIVAIATRNPDNTYTVVNVLWEPTIRQGQPDFMAKGECDWLNNHLVGRDAFACINVINPHSNNSSGSWMYYLGIGIHDRLITLNQDLEVARAASTT